MIVTIREMVFFLSLHDYYKKRKTPLSYHFYRLQRKKQTNKQFFREKKKACLLLVFRRPLHVHPQHERPIERGKLFSLTEISLIC